MYKNPIEQLEKEEQELEAMILGTPSEDETTEAEATTKEPMKEEAPEATELVPQKPTPEPTKESSEDWEKRYKNLRASRDENLWKAKADLATALDKIQWLQSELTKLQKNVPTVDPLEGVFTEEDTETLGEATIEVMRKATRKATEAATAPLQRELENERKRRSEQDKRMAEAAKKDAYDVFLRRISTAVPNWEAINFDPGFEKFMSEPDYDGTPRKTYFHAAEAQGNSALIIRYMKEYEGTQKKDKLASKVTPLGDSTGTTTMTGKKPGEKITKAYIDKFYDDLTRGKYRGKASEADAIEAAIDKAVREGRVVA